MNALLKRLVLIATVIFLFFIPNITIPLLINCVLLAIILGIEIISRKIRFETLAFFLTYSTMLTVHLIEPKIEILPRMPFFIYPILAGMALLSLIIRQPFTNGFSLQRTETIIPQTAWFASIIWTCAFIAAGILAFYFFPNHLYILASFAMIAMAVVLNIFIGRISAS